MYNIMKPGLYLWGEKRRKADTSTHIELIIRGQERDGQQGRQTFICLAAGEETAPLQELHVRLEKKKLLEAKLLHKEILFFSLESEGFWSHNLYRRDREKDVVRE